MHYYVEIDGATKEVCCKAVADGDGRVDFRVGDQTVATLLTTGVLAILPIQEKDGLCLTSAGRIQTCH